MPITSWKRQTDSISAPIRQIVVPESTGLSTAVAALDRFSAQLAAGAMAYQQSLNEAEFNKLSADLKYRFLDLRAHANGVQLGQVNADPTAEYNPEDPLNDTSLTLRQRHQKHLEAHKAEFLEQASNKRVYRALEVEYDQTSLAYLEAVQTYQFEQQALDSAAAQTQAMQAEMGVFLVGNPTTEKFQDYKNELTAIAGGWTPEAQDMYTTGVTESINQMAQDSPKAAMAFLQQNEDALDSAAPGLHSTLVKMVREEKNYQRAERAAIQAEHDRAVKRQQELAATAYAVSVVDTLMGVEGTDVKETMLSVRNAMATGELSEATGRTYINRLLTSQDQSVPTTYTQHTLAAMSGTLDRVQAEQDLNAGRLSVEDFSAVVKIQDQEIDEADEGAFEDKKLVVQGLKRRFGETTMWGMGMQLVKAQQLSGALQTLEKQWQATPKGQRASLFTRNPEGMIILEEQLYNEWSERTADYFKHNRIAVVPAPKAYDPAAMDAVVGE